MKYKILTLIFIVCCLGINAQKIALLSSNTKKPILYTDSLTVQQIKDGYFPVSSVNFDTLYANLKYVKNMLQERSRSKIESFTLRAGSTTLEISREPHAYGDKYLITAVTIIGTTTAKLLLTEKNKKNKENYRYISKLMNYIFTNNSYFKGPNEITPVIENAVIVTEK
jgi:hypothetical protein